MISTRLQGNVTMLARNTLIDMARTDTGIPLFAILFAKEMETWRQYGFYSFSDYLQTDLGFSQEQAEALCQDEIFRPLLALKIRPQDDSERRQK